MIIFFLSNSDGGKDPIMQIGEMLIFLLTLEEQEVESQPEKRNRLLFSSSEHSKKCCYSKEERCLHQTMFFCSSAMISRENKIM